MHYFRRVSGASLSSNFNLGKLRAPLPYQQSPECFECYLQKTTTTKQQTTTNKQTNKRKHQSYSPIIFVVEFEATLSSVVLGVINS